MNAEVSLTRRPPMNPGDVLDNEPDVQSYGYVEVISTVYNEIDFSAHITGNHWIHHSESRGMIVAAHTIDTYGIYNNGSVRAGTDFGSCYRASLTATSASDT
jgi:hypothetical protein